MLTSIGLLARHDGFDHAKQDHNRAAGNVPIFGGVRLNADKGDIGVIQTVGEPSLERHVPQFLHFGFVVGDGGRAMYAQVGVFARVRITKARIRAVFQSASFPESLPVKNQIVPSGSTVEVHIGRLDSLLSGSKWQNMVMVTSLISSVILSKASWAIKSLCILSSAMNELIWVEKKTFVCSILSQTKVVYNTLALVKMLACNSVDQELDFVQLQQKT